MSGLIRKILSNNIFAKERNTFLITQNTQGLFKNKFDINQSLSKCKYRDNHQQIFRNKTRQSLKPNTFFKTNIYHDSKRNIAQKNVIINTIYSQNYPTLQWNNDKEYYIPRILKEIDKNKNSLTYNNTPNLIKTINNCSAYQEYKQYLNVKINTNSLNKKKLNSNKFIKTKTQSFSNFETNDDYLNQILKQRKILKDQIISRHRSLHGNYRSQNLNEKKKSFNEEKDIIFGNLIFIENKKLDRERNNNIFSNDIIKEKLLSNNNKSWYKTINFKTKDEDRYKNSLNYFNENSPKKNISRCNFFTIKLH